MSPDLVINIKYDLPMMPNGPGTPTLNSMAYFAALERPEETEFNLI